jgi:DNA-binding PadR family transcriptional regulator
MYMRDLTDSELLVLSLVAEMPRHGYELEQIIEKRGMREWTQTAPNKRKIVIRQPVI